jgi:NADPH:quinone reductase-like Zn-dependent oxidoreductase
MIFARLSFIQTRLKSTVKMPQNTAAWITAPRSNLLVVEEAPYPTPGADELVVRNHAVAINPLDVKIQDHDPQIAGRAIQYPMILGADLAGTIVSRGRDVSMRKVGERIVANAPGVSTGESSRSAFQDFVVIPESSAIPIPNEISFESACVLPLASYTAMAGLFVKNQLGLSTAGLGDTSATPPSPGSVLLVWGGSSSVGCCAIQMARAAGYEVYTVASERNRALCLSIGANKVFDRSDDNVERLLVESLKEMTLVGALDCIADKESTVSACARILSQIDGCKKVITVLAPPQAEPVEGVKAQRGKLHYDSGFGLR